ncbi:hypothetical protein GOODEAATRI_012185 [Goodea atripinnis]|uniref:Uncharacterized protein n=1 Tax=Goodea atripinnis TaxID=208336 RepID=A0ABV0NWK6_9TELE
MPLCLSVFLRFHFALLLPIHSLPITSLNSLLFLSYFHLSLSSYILLLTYLYSPHKFSSILTFSPGISCLCRWESVKRHCDYQLRNSLLSLRDSSPFKAIFVSAVILTPPLNVAIVGKSLSASAPFPDVEKLRNNFGLDKHLSQDATCPKYTSLLSGIR